MTPKLVTPLAVLTSNIRTWAKPEILKQVYLSGVSRGVVIPNCNKIKLWRRQCLTSLFYHITDADALIILHWLRVPEPMTFKVAMLTYRALHGSAPQYLLASSFTCVADIPHRRRLRYGSTERLDVPTCRRSTVGGRAFSVAGAKVCNSLPNDVTSASSLAVFKNRLKTYMYLSRSCYEIV